MVFIWSFVHTFSWHGDNITKHTPKYKVPFFLLRSTTQALVNSQQQSAMGATDYTQYYTLRRKSISSKTKTFKIHDTIFPYNFKSSFKVPSFPIQEGTPSS